MAVDLHDGEFLLPSQFLTDDDIISENQHINNKSSRETSPHFTWDISKDFISCGSSSGFSSPVESPEMGSTGTEREKEGEDYIAELTHHMTHCMIQEDGDNLTQSMPRYLDDQILWSSIQKPTSGLADLEKNSSVWTQSNQAFSHDQLRAIQLYQLKQQQLMKQQGTLIREPREKLIQNLEPKQQQQQMKYRNRASGGFVNGRSNHSPLVSYSSSAWPPLQSGSSGMRAMFLRGSSGSRNGSCGTGVFLPPTNLNSSEPRKKRGCSTVLIPARVAHALKLHFDNMGSALSPYNAAAAFPLQHETTMGDNRGLSKQKRHTQNLPGTNHYHEMGLPQEWTY